MTGPVAAVTGGTGFFGRYIVAALVQAGWRTRLLARRDPVHPSLAGLPLELVPGDLDDDAALSELVRDASVVIHAAGLVKARSRKEFFAVNRDGAARLARVVALVAPRARFILISSIAARTPGLSSYGDSKRAGEAAVTAALGEGSWVVLRPCVIYGPWDLEGLALLRMARGWIAPVLTRPEPRIAMIHARDAAASVVALSRDGSSKAIFDISDRRPAGYGWTELLQVAGTELGRVPHTVPVPDLLLRAAGVASDVMTALSGRPALLGQGKVRDILHRDWASDRNSQPSERIWSPQVDLRTGLKDTIAWWKTNLDGK